MVLNCGNGKWCHLFLSIYKSYSATITYSGFRNTIKIQVIDAKNITIMKCDKHKSIYFQGFKSLEHIT